MGYASLSGRAITNPDAPRAFGVCDRCARWFNHCDLRWQHDYRGRTLQNVRILVCEDCEDEPQPQLKPRIIPPDPLPIVNARVEPFFYDSTNDRITTNPALPPVSFATSGNITLSGFQFIDGLQMADGDLILVKSQDNLSENGIYKVSSGLWQLQGFDSKNKVYIDASSIDTSKTGNVLYLWQLGCYKGAVYVARGMYLSQLFQIDFGNLNAQVGFGSVTIGNVSPNTVNRIDLFTGLYLAGDNETRITQGDNTRVTQQTGSAPGSKNLFPGTRFTVPEDATAGVPYNAVGVPNTGRLSTVTDYVVWTNNSPNYNWWTDNEEAELYWGA